jgi:hypothetical protein
VLSIASDSKLYHIHSAAPQKQESAKKQQKYLEKALIKARPNKKSDAFHESDEIFIAANGHKTGE